MYNVQFTMYNLASAVMACTIYHVQCTIWLAQKGITQKMGKCINENCTL